MYRKRFRKLYSVGITTMLILSSLISLFLWDGMDSVAAENPLTPITTITGPDKGDNFGWNVSWVGDVNGDGFDDIIAGAPYADRYLGGDWWDNSWSYRRKLTFDNSGQSENLVNFPVLVNLNSSNFDYSNAKLDGTDLRFIDKDGVTELNYEIESWDPSGNSYIWVNVTNIEANSNTDFIWIYYGNLNAYSPANSNGVWDSNYASVWHLNDDFLDSTSNTNDGTNFGSTNATGRIADGQDFDGNDDYINAGSDSSIANLFAGGGTIAAWIYPTGWGGGSYGRILDKSTSTLGADGWGWCVDNIAPVSQHILFYRNFTTERGLWYTPANSISLNQWQYIVVTYDESSTSNDPTIYINSVQQTLGQDDFPSGTPSNDTAQSLYIGDFMGGGRTFNGAIDEIRISNIARSTDWVRAQYLSMNNSFLTYGDEETRDWWDTGFSFRQKLTFDNSGQSEDLVNFPVLVNLSSLNFDYLKAKLDGTDLRFIDEDGITELNYDIEFWNSSGNSYIWVNVTRIDADSSTDHIWMYYGNPAASDGQNKSGTYDSSYVGVWHLNEMGNGTSNEFEDSTFYDNDGQGGSGTAGYVPTRIEGKIGGGQNFNGIDDHINCGYDTSLDIGGTQITLEAWINFAGYDPSHYIGIMSHGGWTEGYRLVIRHNGNPLYFHLPEDASWLGASQDTPTDSWVHVVCVYNGSKMIIYINGIKDSNEQIKTDNIETTPKEFWIGHGDNLVGETYSYPWNGSIDEVRVSNIARSSDWIKAQHLSMNDTFITFGNEETRDWWNSGWLYRKKLIFDNSGQSEDLVNFPILVNLSASNFDYLKAKLDGTDLRFIDEHGVTELKYHIEDWNSSGNSFVWVNVTNIAGGSSTDYIWMYYGNSAAPDVQDVSGTYDESYVGVWHLNETTGNALDSTSYNIDGTPSGGVTQGTTGKIDGAYDFDGVDGNVYMGDPADGHLDFGNRSFTISLWANIDQNTGTWQSLLYKGGGSVSTKGYLFETVEDGSRVYVSLSDGSSTEISETVNIAFDTWFYLTGVINRTGNLLHVYKDGSEVGFPVVISAIGNLDTTEALQLSFTTYPANTIIDEVRISNVIRSTDWIKAQYLCMNNSIITYGGEEALKEDCGAAYLFFGHPGITLNNIYASDANVTIYGSNAGDLFGWSVSDAGDVNNDGYDDVIIGAPGWGADRGRAYIFHGRATSSWNSVYDADIDADVILTGENDGDKFGFSVSGAGNINSDGLSGEFYEDWLYRKKITIDSSKVMDDLANFPVLINITDSDLQSKARSDGYDIFFTKLDGVTKLDHEIESYNNSNGELVSWVRIPSLSSSKDTVIYMYYGNSGQTTSMENPTGVWDDNYVGVWHLAEKSGNAKDSTSYDTDGTIIGTVTQGAPGKIDGAYEFDGGDCNVNMNDPIDGHLDFGMDSFTLSIWIKDYPYSLYQDIVYKGARSEGSQGYALYRRWNNEPACWAVGDTIDRVQVDFNYTQDGTWRYIVCVVDRSSNVSRVYVNGIEQGSGMDISTIGMISSDFQFQVSEDGNEVNGTLDEVRMVRAVRSLEWILTEFNNQNDTSTFYTVGNEEIIPQNWLYRKPINIDSSKVISDLTDFPLLINIIDSDLQSKARPDGYDIVFTKSDGRIALDHEIESYDTSSGELIAWVRIPSLSSSSNTIIYMYYGKSGINSPTENPSGVWDVNYRGVWHLSEESGNALDSTTYSTSGTLNGAVTQGQTGKFGYAYDFGGEGAYVNMGDPADGHLDFGNESFTYSTWVNVDLDTGTWEMLVWKGGNTDTRSGYGLETSSTVSNFRHYISDGTSQKVSTGTSLAFDTWYHLAMVINRSSNIMRFYRNGTEVTPAIDISGIGDVNSTINLSFSRPTYSLDGLIDEVRIIAGAKTADWITTEYNNQNDTSSFYTVGAEECRPQNWLYRKPITINSSQVTDNLIDFPMLIQVTDNDLKSKARSDGYDIMFTESDRITRLDHEIESYDSSSGELVAWVRIPSLSSSSDTIIYMYYGKTSQSSPSENPADVWDSNYLAVWHMNEEGDGTADEYEDSTSNSYDGRGGNGDLQKIPNRVTGKMGGGQLFDGFNDYIDVSSMDPYNWGNFTISAWYKSTNSSVSDDEYIFSHVEVYGDGPGIAFGPTDDPENGGHPDELRLYYSNSTLVETEYYSGTDVVDQEYHYLVITRDSTRIKVYDNGNMESNTSDSNAGKVLNVDMPSTGPYIGDYPGETEQVDGIVDELRISIVPRSADWVATEFNNQNDTSSFYTVGNEEIISNNWQYRKPITINASKVAGDLTDFPMLIQIKDADLKTKARSDGYDIIFTGDDGWTRLDHEIEKYNGSSGELIAWIRIPYLSSSSDTVIYMHYGNSYQILPTENPSGVWDDNYKGVWHLNDDLLDSTSNDQDGINGGSISASGRFADGQEFDDTNYVYVPDFSSNILNSTLTMSGWVNASTPDGSHDGYFGIRNDVDADFYALRRSSGTEMEFRFRESSGSSHTIVPFPQSISNEWHYISFVYDGNDVRAYINGAQEGGIVSSSGYIMNGSVDLFIGNDSRNNRLIGVIDEVRFSNTDRSAGWIETEFNNQNDTSSFYTVGNEEINPENWLYRKPITINASKVAGDLTDFPMLIQITDTDLKNKAHSDGYDIMFTESDGRTKLDHEIERYNSSSGELIAWVKIPFLSSSSGTLIYMHYGNPDAPDQQNIEGVWSNGFIGVYHMVEETGNINNSASSTNDGSRFDTPTRTSGQIGYGQEFTGSGADDYFNVGNLGIADGINENITISVWANINNAATEDWGKIVSKRNETDDASTYRLQMTNDPDKRLSLELNAVSSDDCDIAKDTWVYITATYNGSVRYIFINGTQVYNGALSGPLWGSSKNVYIGVRKKESSAPDYKFGGILDEVRLSKAARSASWVITEFNNQNDTSTFYSLGSEEQIGEGQTDNYDDVIIGAYGYGSDQGRAYIFFGESGFTGKISAGDANVIINGTTPNDRLGWDVSRAGDVNNDSLGDMIIGAPGNNSNAGAAYIFYGNNSMPSFIDVTDADRIMVGSSNGEEFGFSVSYIADVNIDGCDDVIVGAPGYNSNQGRAYIFYSAGSNDIVTSNQGDDTVTIYNGTGNNNWEANNTLSVGWWPYSVFVGDANNDGYNDILTPDYMDDTVTIYNGTNGNGWEMKSTIDVGNGPMSVFVADANNDGCNDILTADYWDNTVTIFNGTSNGVWEAKCTLSVGTNPHSIFVGDANNDGYNDILTTDMTDNNVTVYNGTSSGGWEDKCILEVGTEPYSIFVGDANNDGYNDIVTSDYGGNTVTIYNGTGSGGWEAKSTLSVGTWPQSVFIGDANNDGYNDILTANNGADTVTIYNGTSTGEWETKFTLSVGINPRSVFVGDANNDGYNDILTADWGDNTVTIYNGTSSGGWESIGKLYVGDGPWSVFVANANNEDFLTIDGESTGDRFGYSVHSAWDVNGDGIPDVIVGAPYYDDGAKTDAGAIYVFEGGASMDSIADWSYKGEYANDHLGWSVSFAGNLNGDGLTYLIVGAPNNDDGGVDTGKVYILTETSTKPIISNVLATPIIQNIGGYVNITCDIVALSGVNEAWVNITLPGGGYTNVSMIQGIGDLWFYNNNYTIPGQYQYTIWASSTLGNWTKSSVFQFQVINSPPLLSSAQVNPLSGYTDTRFNFTVTYTDLDNHAPNNITVNITGIGVFDLIEVDPSDTNYIDGKDYYYNTSGFSVGLYSFHFAANDTLGDWYETTLIPGLQILNTQPVLLSPAVDPNSGTNITYFNFTVDYMDLDNHPPGNITLNLSGPSGGVFELIEVDPLDMNYIDGKEYYYNTTLLEGLYSFHFAANDSLGYWEETVEVNLPLVGIPKPVLTELDVSPNSGYVDTWFNFTVNYSHILNMAPCNITLNLSGPSGGIFELIEGDPLDMNFTDGKLYFFNMSNLEVGQYAFHFSANDTLGNWTESVILQFDVVNRAPMLSLEQVDPIIGYIDTWFNFTVIYTDLDNHPSDIITVNITGVVVYDLIEIDPLDTDYIDGKLYYYNISGFTLGQYSFHFAANDTFGNWTEGTVLQFDVIDRDPMLSLNQVDPTVGYIDTWFNFTVIYTDLDNNAPFTIPVNITGVGVYSLLQVDPLDIDYTDGKSYYYNATSFAPGQYYFHFAANNTIGNWIETGTLQFDVINRVPTLSLAQVNPSVGDIDSTFNFTVVYTDLDNQPPDIITVNITGTGVYNLIGLDPLDIDYTDGKVYYYNTSGFSIGSYSFNFAAKDTQGDWVETIVFNFDVIDRVPTLLFEQVDPNTGYTDTWFNFTITYTDLDNHAPNVITVNITGIGVYDLFALDPMDMDYTDGKDYYYNLSGFAVGQYSLKFVVNDTLGNWVETGILQFDVLDRAPLLSLEQVNPTIGYTDTWFNFTVNYTDLDNHAPFNITLNLSGTSGGIFELVEVDPSDSDYWNGKEYYYNTTLTSGLYSFHFAAIDLEGMWALETVEINSPNVIPKQGYLEAIDYTAEFSDEIYLNATLFDNLNNPILDENIAFYIDKNKNGIYEVGEFVGAGTTSADGNVSVIYSIYIAPGIYNFNAIYIGSGDHVVNDDEALLIIYAKGATLTAISDIVEEDEVVSLTAILIDIHSNPISFEQVKFFIDKNKNGIYDPSESIGSGTTSAGGVALITYTVNLAPENYGIWAKYVGSSNYTVNEIEGLLTVQNIGNRPPSILGKVPDQIKPEDSLPWPLDLTSYEADLEDSGPDLKWYLTGIDTSLYSVTGMNSSDDIFTFIPVPDAFGNDEVMLWLWDSSGNRVSQVLWVNITPENDLPYFNPLPPNLFVHYDDPNTNDDDPIPWDYTFYVHDIETAIGDLIITTSEPTVNAGRGYAEVDGLKVTFHYPQDRAGESIAVFLTLSDGTDKAQTMIWVNVTSDWVPELVGKLPDIVLEENTTLYNVFDLDDYFIDKDHDSLYFSSGYFHINVNINENNTVDITAIGHWTGSELVTFRAWDPIGAIAEDTITVTVIPVNNPPVISGVPNLVVHYDYYYAFDLSPYIFDLDNHTYELIVRTSEPTNYIWLQQQNNLGIVVNYPEEMDGISIPVTIYVSDGIEIASQQILINVTSNFPPELIHNLPDVFFDEDTVLRNAFRLSDYFIDIDSYVLFYTNGTKFINATINENLTVDFSAPENWYGFEIVTFRATDPMGALAEDKILVVVVPVNDAPAIKSIPTQEKGEGDEWLLDLLQYIDDVDNNASELIITIQSEAGQGYVSLVGTILMFQYPEGIREDIITITVSDGELDASRSFIVNIKSSQRVAPSIWDLIPWPWVILFLFAGTSGAFAFYKKKSRYWVYEAFLIHEDGLPIAHASKEESLGLDNVVVSGMFTAVQNFINDTFSEQTSEDDWELDEMKFGDHKILIERSKPLYLAVIFEGYGSKLRHRVKKLLRVIDENFGTIFEDWDGDMSKLEDIKAMIASLIIKKGRHHGSEDLPSQSQEEARSDEFESNAKDLEVIKKVGVEELEEFLEGVEKTLLGIVGNEEVEVVEIDVLVCPICGKEIEAKVNKCPRCGVEFTELEDVLPPSSLKPENGES